MESNLSPDQNVFRPTWRRGFFAFILAAIGFLLPQEVPLEWCPLNEPGNDINYLEISYASDKAGDVQISYDLGQHGHQSIDTIRFSISPSDKTYTSSFPLPDAPIVALRVNPPTQGGTLRIRQMRIINRRGEEIRRFTRDLFRAEHEIEAITPSIEGWKLTSTASATNPITRIELFSPIIPVGKDYRNLLRCLLSTGYLSMMLWILLLAVLFTFYRPTNWHVLFAHLGFMACLAILFAFVGNRGLIRNSIHYARYVSWPVDPGLKLEFDLLSSSPSTTQLFFDTGQGLNEAGSNRQPYESHQGLQTLRFALPDEPLHALRFNPRNGEGRLEIRGIRIVDGGQRTQAVLPLNALLARHDIARLLVGPDSLTIETAPESDNPTMEFNPATLAIVNEIVARQKKR